MIYVDSARNLKFTDAILDLVAGFQHDEVGVLSTLVNPRFTAISLP